MILIKIYYDKKNKQIKFTYKYFLILKRILFNNEDSI